MSQGVNGLDPNQVNKRTASNWVLVALNFIREFSLGSTIGNVGDFKEQVKNLAAHRSKIRGKSLLRYRDVKNS